ncbi:hypothetical protein H1S01_06460 [Heliobacterium chlorum]|uniref:Uncharacterized protein n=1 Tax=Heliobacterium chlorum TaxID=2698 RepID=A0ABR7T1S8_HELCL|nr:hypothetical protein [Heliobacterium chlorum]MBC9784152.1 hypothetical protein [Heliobacterium chlorum]
MSLEERTQELEVQSGELHRRMQEVEKRTDDLQKRTRELVQRLDEAISMNNLFLAFIESNGLTQEFKAFSERLTSPNGKFN